jgi:hypothetical protein
MDARKQKALSRHAAIIPHSNTSAGRSAWLEFRISVVFVRAQWSVWGVFHGIIPQNRVTGARQPNALRSRISPPQTRRWNPERANTNQQKRVSADPSNPFMTLGKLPETYGRNKKRAVTIIQIIGLCTRGDTTTLFVRGTFLTHKAAAHWMIGHVGVLRLINLTEP